ncbi:MAG: tetratricopeptide repeat protein [Gammaproteobacteria bacterium]|nr:tetratricopeptide repeat protein [Gammaproteobacteria bacterium]
MPTDLSGDIEGLVADGDLATADRRCVESLQNDPQNHEALYWRGIVRMQAGQLQEALAYLQGAIEIAPDVPAYHANRGRCLAQNRQTKQAVQAARRALALDPGDALTLDTIGVIFSVAGEHAEAVAALERAVQIDPHRAPYWYNLGASRKYNGDFTGAEDAYRNALRLQPDMDKASAALAHLRRQQPDADQVDNLRVRLQNFAGDINDEMRLRYALAKALDDIGDAAGAFTELDTAAGKWRAAHPYDFSEDAAVFDALLSGIDAAAVSAATPGYANNEPVFIVGMPRTGTTLTERIVTSHSTVHAAGELSHFDRLIRQRLKIERKEDFSTDGIRSLLSSDLAQLGRDYIDATRPATGHTPHFVDKMPLNFMYAGIMLLALPGAKIICLRRNPMDTCLSNFRQLFSLRSAYYRYSYDLLDCGRYYQMFDRLMRHWQQLFPDRIYTQHYEHLVADQEQQTRALLEYCELDWEDACLRFEKNATPVATASSAQVRQPIYTDAAERWTRYREQLRPLTEFFATTGISV